jgi:hypothetical protein
MKKVLLLLLLIAAVAVSPLFANPVYSKTSTVLTSAATRFPASGNAQYQSADFQPTSCDFVNNDATSTVYVDYGGGTAVTDGSTTTSIPIPPLMSKHVPGCTAKWVSARATGGSVSLTVVIERGAP